VLDRLVKLIGRQTEDCRAAVLWVEDGQILFHAPNLAVGFIASMKSRLLPLASALAEGAWSGKLNIGITNLQTDSMWRDIEQDPADRFEICWTLPIRSNDGVPLGIITVFTRRSSGPGDVEAQILAMASRLTTISIEHHQTTRQLSHLVRHDSLTGLPNRVLFEDRLQQAMMLAHRNSKEIAMLVLDLDHFKSINDTHGHQTGDALLQQFAYRMQRKLRDTDTLARVGGDEFLILLPEISGIEGAKYVAGRLVEALIEPFRIGEHELRVTTSIGIAIYPQDGQDCMTLHHRADAAMYRAKQDGRNAFAV
jgi:diguanylate cyclase (GGDEF)-like protein